MYSRVLLISIPSQRKGELSPHLARARDCLAVSTVDQENTVVWALHAFLFRIVHVVIEVKYVYHATRLKMACLVPK